MIAHAKYWTNRLFHPCLVVAFSLGVLAQAHAQPWPTKPVRVLISNGPGSSADLVARLLSDRLSRVLGQQFVVDNRVGGNDVIGADAAAKSTPDGYSFYFGSASAVVTNAFMLKSLPYDPVRDFAPVSMVVDTAPFVIAVHPDQPAKNLAELITLAKAQPGKLSYAVSTPIASIAGQWLKKLAGIEMEQIWYKSVPQGISDTAANRTQLIIANYPQIQAFIGAGKLRSLAVTSVRRFPVLPGVPAVSEVFPGFGWDGWFALFAPASTPGAIVERMNREVAKALGEPEVRDRLRSFGLVARGTETPQAISEILRAERERWGRIFKDIGYQPE